MRQGDSWLYRWAQCTYEVHARCIETRIATLIATVYPLRMAGPARPRLQLHACIAAQLLVQDLRRSRSGPDPHDAGLLLGLNLGPGLHVELACK